MKKIISVILIVIVMVLSLTSCEALDELKDIINSITGENNTDDNNDEGEKPDVYAQLNELLKNKVDSLSLDVKTENNGVMLEGTYRIDSNKDGSYTVTYSYEENTEIDLENGVFPDETVITVTGVVTVNNGVVTDGDGNVIADNVEIGTGLGMNFQEQFFKNVVSDDESFSADVIDSRGFMQSEFAGDELKVSVDFNSEKINQIILSYTQNGTATVYTYVFDK